MLISGFNIRKCTPQKITIELGLRDIIVWSLVYYKADTCAVMGGSGWLSGPSSHVSLPQGSPG